MNARVIRQIAADLRAAVAEVPDIDAVMLAARRLDAQAEMAEVGCESAA